MPVAVLPTDLRLPFLVGGALLTGVATTSLIEHVWGHRVVVLTCAIIVPPNRLGTPPTTPRAHERSSVRFSKRSWT